MTQVNKNWRVLVIAELETLGRLISNLLNKEGFDVTVADAFGPTEEVYVEFSGKEYDMVLPTNNGMTPSKIPEIAAEIKKKHPGVKIVVLSGFVSLTFVNDLKEQGIDDFLSMPFVPDDLVQRVKAILVN